MDAGAEPARSLVGWIFSALGFPYVILLPLAGLACFALALIIVLRGKGAMAVAALVLIVHVPLLIGMFAAIHGAISSFMVIASAGSTPKAAEVVSGFSIALVAPLVGMLFMVPAYATAAVGAFVRSLGAETERSKSL